MEQEVCKLAFEASKASAAFKSSFSTANSKGRQPRNTQGPPNARMSGPPKPRGVRIVSMFAGGVVVGRVEMLRQFTANSSIVLLVWSENSPEVKCPQTTNRFVFNQTSSPTPPHHPCLTHVPPHPPPHPTPPRLFSTSDAPAASSCRAASICPNCTAQWRAVSPRPPVDNRRSRGASRRACFNQHVWKKRDDVTMS